MALFRRRAHAPSDAPAREREWRAVIARHGWMVMAVPGDEERPGFAFTVGLTERDLPELIAYGLGGELAMHVLNEAAQRVVDGTVYADGELVPGVLMGDFRTQLWDTTWLQDPLGAAFQLYGQDRVRVRQLVVPDLEDRLPWEAGFAVPELQPLLFVAPDGSGPRRAGPPEVDHDHEAPTAWDLPQDPHLGVITAVSVAERDRPALLVVHGPEGEWDVLDGVAEPTADDLRVVCLHHVVELDPTLGDLFRTLPPRREAARAAIGEPWVEAPYVDD